MCNAGWTDCGGTVVDGGSGAGGGGAGDGGTVAGCFANLENDPSNCGTLRHGLPRQRAVPGWRVRPLLPQGHRRLHMPPMPDDTCSTTLGTNKNCNFCGDTCNLPNSNSQCTPGTGMNTCNLISCNPGYANCDTSASNGCETNTNTDANNCDSCGNVCPSGPNSSAVCDNGVCGLICATGYSNCDNNPANGCEVNTEATPTTAACAARSAARTTPREVCNSGVCTIMPCTSPYLDCDMSAADGCEVNPQTDVNNCGKCGNVCKTANGTPSCVGGVCGILSCNKGYSHCAATGTDCEDPTGTDIGNCGSCGNACSTTNDTPSCSNGVCSIQCATGWGNCDGNIANGCETQLNTVANCGVCAPMGMPTCTTTNGMPTCNTATMPPSCAVGSCSMGYANCPGNGTNCSTFILGNDTNNCGGCNKVCGSDATSNGTLHDSGACVAGQCTVGTCDPGWADCDGDLSNGCETAIDTVSHCGSCTISCSTANGTPECTPSGTTFVCGIQSCTSPWIHCAANGGTNCETNPTNDNANCGGCGNVCDVATCGGLAGHVATTTCTAGVCDVTTCSAGYTFTDDKCSDGLYCDCALSTVATTCGSGSQNLGTVPVGANPITFVSNLYPATPNQAYFVVTFTGNTNTSYHPKITISDPLNEFLIEVTSDCSTAITTCNATGDLTSSNGVTSWEESYVGPNPPADPNTYPVTGDKFEAIPPVGNNGVVYVKVYRKGAVTNCNNQYTLTVAN